MTNHHHLVPAKLVGPFLQTHHYLGPSKRGFAWQDDHGVLVFANPSSRQLPQHTWLELVRWCIVSTEPNTGTRQWAQAWRTIYDAMPQITTIVSYSDPSAGHDGALYRACNWLWAPTWHRLRPPPTGNGQWSDGKTQATKDRWIFPLRADEQRQKLLGLSDQTLARKMPWANYQEPTFRRGRPVIGTGGADYKQWRTTT